MQFDASIMYLSTTNVGDEIYDMEDNWFPWFEEFFKWVKGNDGEAIFRSKGVSVVFSLISALAAFRKEYDNCEDLDENRRVMNALVEATLDVINGLLSNLVGIGVGIGVGIAGVYIGGAIGLIPGAITGFTVGYAIGDVAGGMAFEKLLDWLVHEKFDERERSFSDWLKDEYAEYVEKEEAKLRKEEQERKERDRENEGKDRDEIIKEDIWEDILKPFFFPNLREEAN